MRTLGCLLAVALSTAASLLAQDTAATGRSADLPCYHARSKPACSVFFLTNAGGYVTRRSGTTGSRALVDWGVMVNVGERDAIGASFFALQDNEGGGAAGPVVRYRRWLRPPTSLDVAVGTAIVGDVKTGSLYGLVKWNPVHWFGVAARPDLIRQTVYTGCATFSCTPVTQSHAHLSFGVEFGWVPGLVLTAGGGLAVVVALATLVGSN